MDKKYVLFFIILFIDKDGTLGASFGSGDGYVLTDFSSGLDESYAIMK